MKRSRRNDFLYVTTCIALTNTALNLLNPQPGAILERDSVGIALLTDN